MEKAAIHSHGRWSEAPPIPGGHRTDFPGIGTAPDGSVLFVMTGFKVGDYGTVATWLRP
jgi:hypothetical protein